MEDGVVVPEVLRPYMPGNPEFIPFKKELPKDSTSFQTGEGKAKGKAEAAVNTVAEKMEKLKP